MNWLNGFELMCYLIVALLLADRLRRKDYNSLFTFGAAALVGFTMELLAVAVTDIYYYNPAFWLNLGREPKQFPVFGGFMWGGLTVYGILLAEKLRLGKWGTALTAGWLPAICRRLFSGRPCTATAWQGSWRWTSIGLTHGSW